MRGTPLSGAARIAFLLLLASGTPTRAQGPPDTPESYLILGLSKVDVSNSISGLSGSIGVNKSGGTLTGNGRVDFADGIIAGDNVSLNQPSMCQALFANHASGSGLCAQLQPVSLPLVPNLKGTDVCALPNPFPACNSARPPVTVTGETRQLEPGVYGDLTVGDGGTVQLAGTYVFCNVTTNNGSNVVTLQPTTLQVVDRVNVNANSFVNVTGAPADLRILVNGLGVNVHGQDTALVLDAPAPAEAGAGILLREQIMPFQTGHAGATIGKFSRALTHDGRRPDLRTTAERADESHDGRSLRHVRGGRDQRRQRPGRHQPRHTDDDTPDDHLHHDDDHDLLDLHLNHLHHDIDFDDHDHE